MLHDTAQWLFSSPGLAPHALIRLNAMSNIGIGLSCLSVPFALMKIVRHRPDLITRPAMTLSAAFILLSAAAHWLDLLTAWVPAYGIQAFVNTATAITSILIAGAVWCRMARILALPFPAQSVHPTTALKEQMQNEDRFGRLQQSSVTEPLYFLDPAGTIESWNAGAARIKGYTATEIIGQNFACFFPPEDIASGEPAKILAAASETGHYSSDAWRVRKDGSRFLARMAIDAIRNHDSTLRGFITVIRDITEQRIEEEQRAIIIEAAPNGMMIVNESGIITLANTEVEHIFDYPPGSLVGQPVAMLIPDAAQAWCVELGAGLTIVRTDQGTASQRQFIGRKRNGCPATIEIMISPVKTPRGRIIIAAVFDVTDRVRQAAEQAEAETRERLEASTKNAVLDRLARNLAEARDKSEQANQAKSRFLAGITHELRTPLHGILGYAELLVLEAGLTAKQSERLEVMMVSGQHLLGLINSVLDMSQIEAGQLELQPAEVGLFGLLRVCVDVVRPAAEAKGLALTLTPVAPGTPQNIFADPIRLRQILFNLLGNAIKFTPAGTVELRLRACENGTWIRLEVVDTGPGIRAQHHDKLFQTFERLNAEAVSGIEGAGLGLAIAARLVLLMDGRIGYNDNPGGGSIFWLELPVLGPPAAIGVETATPPPLIAGPRLRVLVADDEVLNRGIASGFLIAAGHEPVCVADGAAAVAAAAGGHFDVILMDVRMPGMNGMEATRHIRALPPPRGEVRIIAVTAQAFARQIDMCLQAGMDDHVSKPFKQAVLLAALQHSETTSRGPRSATPLPETEDEVAVFDRVWFHDNTEFLAAADVMLHLRTLTARSEALLRDLRAPPDPDRIDEHVSDAHKLAGAAGTLGFLSVARAALTFEQAAVANAAETTEMAEQFAAALSAAIPVMQREIIAMTVTAT